MTEEIPVTPEPTPRREGRSLWVRLLIQPVIVLGSGALVIVMLGGAQRLGWISAGGGEQVVSVAGSEKTRYICPMMCTTPQTEPGRCPVCAMDLVPATTSSGEGDEYGVTIEPTARRLANIQVVEARSDVLKRKIRSVGRITYDESSLATIAAYFDGRIDSLLADYTGIVVEKGSHMALIYSPELYAAQTEFVVSLRALKSAEDNSYDRLLESQQNLVAGARQKLIALGMTEDQVGELEANLEPQSHLYLCAPIGGTVIEKLAVKGEYIHTGQAIYRIVDLSTVWLILEMFPEEAAAVRYGQRVELEVRSLPGRSFVGRVAFVDPIVDEKTRTVGVRVVLDNANGLLRPGDYATAHTEVDVLPAGAATGELIYDPELAGKWIGPRHPQVVESSPGTCRLCGTPLVPASEFGFADEPLPAAEVVVIPRTAVMMAGEYSVVYVETEPGRFEIRPVTLGVITDHEAVVLEGVLAGEMVATRGNFLIDSQMQLAGNPSLIDPTRAQSRQVETQSPEVIAALSQLNEADRVLAERQRICPVTEYLLGSMGVPPKVDVNGTPVFICCEGCRGGLLKEPDRYLAVLASAANSDAVSPDGLQMDLPPIGEIQLVPPIGEMRLDEPERTIR